MPSIGDVLSLKVAKIIKNGVFLKNENDQNNYFLHISEMKEGRVRSVYDIVKPGEMINCRVISINKKNNGKITYQVSLKMLDEEKFLNLDTSKHDSVYLEMMEDAFFILK